MLTHPSHLHTFLPSVSLPLSAAFWVTFPGGKKKSAPASRWTVSLCVLPSDAETLDCSLLVEILGT